MILIGRRAERLEELKHLLARAGVEVHCLALDLVRDEAIDAVVRAIESAGPLEYLVNNAGFTIIGGFETLSLAKQLEMVQVHVKAVTAFTYAALPAMKAAGRGTIINVSSMVNFTPYKDVAVYGGTKAYIDNFTRSLAMELQGSGITVQSLVPGFTHTELHDREAFRNYETPHVPDEMWMTPAQVVEESLGGLVSGSTLVVAGAINRAHAIGALEASAALVANSGSTSGHPPAATSRGSTT